MVEGSVYRCQDRACGCEIVVTKASAIEGNANPKCGCGTEMKKPYRPPVLRMLSPDAELLARLDAKRD